MENKKKTQKEFVKAELAKKGFITRNNCLRNYISRLSAYICELKEEGFQFETKKIDEETLYGTQNDFVYFWKNQSEGKLETTYIFKVFDAGNEDKFEIKAKSFNEACSIFLTTPPIFLEEIANEVHTKVGAIFILSDREEFKQFKIKK